MNGTIDTSWGDAGRRPTSNEPSSEDTSSGLGAGGSSGRDGGGAGTTSPDGSSAATAFGVGGTLSGLASGSVVTLRLASGEKMLLSASGRFTFQARHATGDAYAVDVAVQPTSPWQTCLVARGQGTVASGDVDDVAVDCTTSTYAVGGTVSGLVGGTVLVLGNGQDRLAVTAGGPFKFAAPVASGNPYGVVIASEPAGQTCSVTEGSGTIAGSDVSQVAVACAPTGSTSTVTIGGTVAGAGMEGLVVADGAGNKTTIAGAGPFQLPGLAAQGSPYAVRLFAQPPGGLCTLSGATGVASANVTSLAITCAPASVGRVRINEVSATYYGSVPSWMELYNDSEVVADLSLYKLRSATGVAVAASQYTSTPQTFTFPANVRIPARGHILVRGKTAGQTDGPQVVYVSSGAYAPYWNNGVGALEVTVGETTSDYVRFGGTSAAGPTTAGHWSGGAASAAPHGSPGVYGRSLARNRAVADSDSPSDWSLVSYATPAGPNDVTCDVDADADGIPDCSEAPGATFAGVDLYGYGARPGTRDIFLEIDYMNPKGLNGSAVDPALMPRKEALDAMVRAFARRGIALHVDAGSLYDAQPGLNPAAHDLGGGGDVIPFVRSVAFTHIHTVKPLFMDMRRLLSFHYMTMVNVVPDAGGVAELLGNDIVIALGENGYSTASTPSVNRLINDQSHVMMHELGHNLGLRHGGNDDANYKTNYMSVMNYYYAYIGLPTMGSNEGDRFFHAVASSSCAARHGAETLASLVGSPLGSPEGYRLDFSDGSSPALDERNLQERLGFGRAGSAAVDWSCDGTIQTQSVAVDLNSDDDLTVSHDFNDWGNLSLSLRTVQSDYDFRALQRVPVRDVGSDDEQAVYPEVPTFFRGPVRP